MSDEHTHDELINEIRAYIGRPTPADQEAARIEHDRQMAERQALGPEYLACFCLGEGATGERLGLAVLGAAGEVLLAHIDGERQYTRERICTCPEGLAFKADVERRRQVAADQLRAARIARVAGAADIPRLYRGLTVKSWAERATANGGDDNAIGAVMADVWDWAHPGEDGGPALLLLAGNQGVGKSGIAAALAQEWVDLEHSVLYRSVPRLATALRAAPWRARKEPDALPTELELLGALSEADLLILDDLGAEALTAGNHEILKALIFDILDARMAAERLTIVTSNLTSDELMGRYGARIHDRLYAPAVAQCVVVDVPNLRWPTG